MSGGPADRRKVYHYLVCSTYAGSGGITCEHTRFHRAGQTEERVAEFVLGLIENPEVLHEEAKRQAESEKKRLRRADTEAERLLGLETKPSRAQRAPSSAASTLPMMHKVLETERMVLRRMEMSDVDNLVGIFSDPVAMRYYPATKSRAEAEAWVSWTLGSYRDHGFGLWVAILKDSGEFAGQCGLTVQEVEGEKEVEIGYLFLRRFWGQGLATEAAKKVRDHGFALGYRRLISIIDPANLASRRVAERTGLTLEKEAIKSGKKVCIYAIGKETRRDPAW